MPAEIDRTDRLNRDFFAEMNQLHHRAGRPSMRTIGSHVGCSHTTVGTVFRGPMIPRFGLVELVVEYLRGDVERFRLLWYRATGGAPEQEQSGSEQSGSAGDGADSAAADRSSPLHGPVGRFHVGGDYVAGNKSGGDTIVSGGKHVHAYSPRDATGPDRERRSLPEPQ